MRFVPDAAGLRLVAQWDVEAPVVEDLVVLVQKHLAWEVGGKKNWDAVVESLARVEKTGTEDENEKEGPVVVVALKIFVVALKIFVVALKIFVVALKIFVAVVVVVVVEVAEDGDEIPDNEEVRSAADVVIDFPKNVGPTPGRENIEASDAVDAVASEVNVGKDPNLIGAMNFASLRASKGVEEGGLMAPKLVGEEELLFGKLKRQGVIVRGITRVGAFTTALEAAAEFRIGRMELRSGGGVKEGAVKEGAEIGPTCENIGTEDGRDV